jgi:hypothetical protein
VYAAGEGIRIESNSIILDSLYLLRFRTGSNTDGAAGAMSWNTTEETVDLVTDQGAVTGHLMESVYYNARNSTGTPIPISYVVMAAGTTGNTGRILIAPAIADGSVNSEYILGITAQAIGNNSNGKVQHFGKIRGIQTNGSNFGETWLDGDVLYCSAATPGYLTKVQPAAPNLKVPIAIVIHAHPNNGTLFVRPSHFPDLAQINDVQLSSPTNGQVLTYNSTLSRWENATPADPSSTNELQTLSTGTNTLTLSNGGGTVTVDTDPASDVTGSGANGQVSFWTGAQTQSGDNGLFWDNTNKRLGVGTISPSTAFHVQGASTLAGLTTVSGDIRPSVNNTYNVGSSTLGFLGMYASNSGIWYFGSAEFARRGGSGGVEFSTAGNNLTIFNSDRTAEIGRFTSTNRNLLLGTTSDVARLHVVGSGTSSSTWTAQFHNSAGNNNALMIRDDGNIGINTNTPNARLQVQGADTSNSNWTAQFHNSLGNSNSLMIRNDGNVGIGTTGTTARLVVRASGSSSGSTAMLVENSGGTSMLMVREDGNVGIGTNTPSFNLEVVGQSRIGGNFDVSTNTSFFVTGSRTDRRITNTFTGSITNSVGYFAGTVDMRGSQAFTAFNGMTFAVNNQNTSASNNITAGNFTVTNDAANAGLSRGIGVVGRFVNSSNVAANDIRCVQGDVSNLLTGSTISNLYLYRAEVASNLGTITNTYGYFVGDITAGTQVNTPYSFYAIDPNAFNYFAGSTGIGTTTPAQTLDVAGTMRLTGSTGTGTTLMARNAAGDVSAVTVGSGLNLSNNTLTATGGGTGTLTGSGTATQVAFWGGTTGSTSTALSGSSSLYWDGINNRLGIGTSTPSAPLTIKSYGNSISTNEAFSIFNSAATPLNLLTVLENGNIGIGGQTSPIYKLDILGNLRLGTSSIQFGIGESGGNSVILGSLTNHPYRFIVNTNEAARFTTDRNLSIGATGSTARLLVVGSQPSGTTTWTAQFHNALGNSNSLMIRDDGNVGVGTSTPNFKLTVQANDAGLLVSGANVSPFTQIIASFVYGGNGNTINVENRGGRASFQARATTAVGAAASPLFLNPNGGTVSVNNDNPDASAIFDVRSTTQGFLPPRMSTANRNLISSPATGLQVYNSSLNVMQHYNGVSWVNEANPILTRVSTGTTQVELFLDGVSSRFGLVGTNKVWNFRIQLCAIVASAGTGTLDIADSYISEHLIGIKRSGSSINVVGGGVVQNLIGANTQMEDSVVTITGDSGTESIRVFYTPPSGAAANTVIRISATLYYTEAGV